MLCLRFRALTIEDWPAAAARSGCVYFIRDADQDRVKVGYSLTPERRRRQLQTGSAGKLKIVGLVATPQIAEDIFHRDLSGFSVRGEWFAAAGVMRWLETKTAGLLLRRCIVDLVDRTPVQVYWEWDEKSKSHRKYISDNASNAWVRADHGAANARPGWSATTSEVPDE